MLRQDFVMKMCIMISMKTVFISRMRANTIATCFHPCHWKGAMGQVQWALGYHIQVARPHYEQLKMPFITGTGLPIWEELPICNLPIFMRQRCGLSIGICNSPSATIGIMMISCFLSNRSLPIRKSLLLSFAMSTIGMK